MHTNVSSTTSTQPSNLASMWTKPSFWQGGRSTHCRGARRSLPWQHESWDPHWTSSSPRPRCSRSRRGNCRWRTSEGRKALVAQQKQQQRSGLFSCPYAASPGPGEAPRTAIAQCPSSAGTAVETIDRSSQKHRGTRDASCSSSHYTTKGSAIFLRLSSVLLRREPQIRTSQIKQ